MALNNFTDEEAIEIAIEVRNNLAVDYDLPLSAQWRDRDALAQVISLAKERISEKNNEAELI